MIPLPYVVAALALALAALGLTGLRWPVRGSLAAALFAGTAVGLPGLAGRARDRAEAPILQNILLIAIKEEQFRSAALNDRDRDGRGEYGTLVELYRARPPLVSDMLAGGEEHGYVFYVVFGPTPDQQERAFYAYAVPQRYGVTGRRAMYVDETGVVRASDAGPLMLVTRETVATWPVVPIADPF